MPMVDLEKEVTASFGHRIPNHPKCGKFHGHNWKFKIRLYGNLPQNGMLVDFSEIKELIDTTFDHKFLLYANDDVTQSLEIAFPGNYFTKLGFAKIPCIPTAENIGLLICHALISKYENVSGVSIDVYESETSKIKTSFWRTPKAQLEENSL